MTHLAKALKKYYIKSEEKIIFKNKTNLNQLALEMWEELDYSQIDKSVLSKVLCGKRIFTAKQLEIFCKLLNVTSEEKDELFYNLNKDYCERYNIELDAFFVPKAHYVEVLDHLLDEIYQANYNGRLSDVIRKCEKIELISQVLTESFLPKSIEEKTYNILAVNLYMKTKSLGAFFKPQEALSQTVNASNKLLAWSKKFDDSDMWCYANILLAHAYYIAGGDTKTTKAKGLYAKAIEHANKVLAHLPVDNRERIFALRLISASASYIKDEEVINFSFLEFNKILASQPKENDMSMYLFAGNLAEGAAILKKSKPFLYKDAVSNHFGEIILDGNIHETSAIKRDIETYVALGSSDKQTIAGLAKKGLILADKYDYPRHQKYLNKIISTL